MLTAALTSKARNTSASAAYTPVGLAAIPRPGFDPYQWRNCRAFGMIAP